MTKCEIKTAFFVFLWTKTEKAVLQDSSTLHVQTLSHE